MTERYRAMTRRRRLLAAIWAGVGATILILLLVSGGRGCRAISTPSCSARARRRWQAEW